MSWSAPDDRFRQEDANHNEWCGAGLHYLGDHGDPSEHCYVDPGGKRFCRACAREKRRTYRRSERQVPGDR